jgi:anti-sigma factor RsiW
MKCQEIHKLIGPYLDSELDAKTSLNIEEHLQTCDDCAGLLEAERRCDERIVSALRRGEKTPELWRQLEARVAAPSFFHRLWRRPRFALVSLAGALVAIVFALSAWFWWRGHPPDLAVVVEQDHREFLAGKFQPDFTGAPTESVVAASGGRLDLAAFVKRPLLSGFRTEGSRLCHLSGVPAAWTLGRYRDVPVSLIVLKRTELEHFPEFRQRLAAGEAVVCSRRGRFHFAARLVGDHVVCVMATTSMRALEDLVKSVPASG